MRSARSACARRPSSLLGELHAVGFWPYLELEHRDRDDPLRLVCELDDELLLDISLGDQGLPDTPPTANEIYWTAFVQGEDGYLAEVMIDQSIQFGALAAKLRDLVEAAAAGERPLLVDWYVLQRRQRGEIGRRRQLAMRESTAEVGREELSLTRLRRR